MATAVFSGFTFKANNYTPPPIIYTYMTSNDLTWPEPPLYLSCVPGVLSGPGTLLKKPDHISMDVTYLNKPKTVVLQQQALRLAVAIIYDIPVPKQHLCLSAPLSRSNKVIAAVRTTTSTQITLSTRCCLHPSLRRRTCASILSLKLASPNSFYSRRCLRERELLSRVRSLMPRSRGKDGWRE